MAFSFPSDVGGVTTLQSHKRPVTKWRRSHRASLQQQKYADAKRRANKSRKHDQDNMSCSDD
jgi:hypothetical protein